MKYNLNLTKNYCSHWTIQNALRELIANTLDEEGTIEFYDLGESIETEELSGTLILKTKGTLPPEAFMMGYSEKRTDNPIGTFGEGLNIAILLLQTHGYDFEVMTPKDKYEFSMEKPEGFSTETLHMTLDRLEEEMHSEYTTIIVYNVLEEDFSAVYTQAPIGIIENDYRLFSQGLYVQNLTIEVDKKEYGLNIDTPIRTNRDRNYLVDKDVIAPFIYNYFTPRQLADIDINDYSTNRLYKLLPDHLRQPVARARMVSWNGAVVEPDESVTVLYHTYYGHTFPIKQGYIIRYDYSGSDLMSDEQRKLLGEWAIKNETSEIPTESEYEKRGKAAVENILEVSTTDLTKYLTTTNTLLLYYLNIPSYHKTTIETNLKKNIEKLDKTKWTNCHTYLDIIHFLADFETDLLRWYLNNEDIIDFESDPDGNMHINIGYPLVENLDFDIVIDFETKTVYYNEDYVIEADDMVVSGKEKDMTAWNLLKTLFTVLKTKGYTSPNKTFTGI